MTAQTAIAMERRAVQDRLSMPRLFFRRLRAGVANPGQLKHFAFQLRQKLSGHFFHRAAQRVIVNFLNRAARAANRKGADVPCGLLVMAGSIGVKAFNTVDETFFHEGFERAVNRGRRAETRGIQCIQNRISRHRPRGFFQQREHRLVMRRKFLFGFQETIYSEFSGLTQGML